MPLTLRAWLRYVVPLTVLSAIACLPILWLASRVGAAPDLPKARAQIRLAWCLAGGAWACQLLLVAGVAPAVRSLAAGAPLSQLRALTAGLRSLVHGVVPCAIAVMAVVLGGVALVVPGALLLVLVSMTGASRQLGAPPPAPIIDSVALARANLARIAVVVAAIVLVDLAIALVAQKLIVPVIAKKIAAAKLVPIRAFVRVVALAIVAVSPLAACALAACYERFTRRTH